MFAKADADWPCPFHILPARVPQKALNFLKTTELHTHICNTPSNGGAVTIKATELSKALNEFIATYNSCLFWTLDIFAAKVQPGFFWTCAQTGQY